MSGFTLIEMSVVILIFALFLMGVYATLDAGMKTWQMGEIKSDIYQKAQIAISNIKKDFINSTLLSTRIYGVPPLYNEYISFETPLKASGSCKISNGMPCWQGYIIYYIAPEKEGTKKNLYRSFNPRALPDTNPFPMKYEDILTTILDIPSGENVRTISKDIYSIDFKIKETNLVFNLSYKINIRKSASVMFTSGASPDKGWEILELKNSVTPRN